MRDEPVLAYRYHGRRFDCGSKLGYLMATVEYALRHPDLSDEFKTYLRSVAARFVDPAPRLSTRR